MKRLTLLLLCVAAALPAAAYAHRGHNDRDGMPNGWEKRYQLNPRVNDAQRDPDRDGLKNIAEYRDHTNPRKADTDNDGLGDGDEVRTGNNPRKADTDRDGMDDGDENAGTVKSFDGKVLTIDLANGKTLSGQVTDATEITCKGSDDQGDDNVPIRPGARTSRHGADDPDGDDRGDDRGGDSGRGSDDNPGNSAPPAGNNGAVVDNHGRGGHGADDASGDDHGNGGNGDDRERSCAKSDLTSGTMVHEAELDGTGPDAVFHEVKLVK
jgi:hypothetical protein